MCDDKLDTIYMNDQDRNEDSDRQVRSVTIRGINAKNYDEFSQKMKSLDMNLGDAVTKMMTDVLEDFDETFPDISSRGFRSNIQLPHTSISHHDSIVISEHDLVSAKSRISFSHCDLVEFKPDITAESFTKYVRSISHCEQVRFPNSLPKLLVYSKLQHSNDVDIYEPETPTTSDLEPST